MDAGSTVVEAAEPPPYTTNNPPSYGIEAQAPSPPTYEHRAACVTFPNVVKAVFVPGKIKSYNLCGEQESVRLYTVEVHTGYSGKTPLGERPGQLLHGGRDIADPIVAATGDESSLAARPYIFNLETIVLLPALPSSRTDFITREGLITERMRARTLDNGDVAFRFSTHVGSMEEKLRQESFEWRKITKGTDEEAPAGGFRLVRLASGEPSHATASSSTEGGEEVVAMLAFRQRGADSRVFWTLQRLGSGLVGAGLGDRWALMVVMTAIRLRSLETGGRTGRRHVAIGLKIHGK